MKVYILVEFVKKGGGEDCRILKVFSNHKAAEERKQRLEEIDQEGNTLRPADTGVNYGIVAKSVNGILHPWGTPGKGRMKVIRMDFKAVKDRLKVSEQREYIKHLERRIQGLKKLLEEKESLFKSGIGNPINCLGSSANDRSL